MIRKATLVVAAMVLTALPARGQSPSGTSQTGSLTGARLGPGSRSGTSQAPSVGLTLEDAVRRAIDHNPDLAIVQLGTEVEAAQVGASQTAYAPVFSTTLARSNITAPPTNFLFGTSGVDTRDWFSSTGVRQRVPRGSGTWSVSWDAARTASNSPLNSFDPSVQSGIQLAYSQPLLRDRKIDAARQQIVITKRNQESSELRFRESVVQTVASVKQAYWTLKALRANVTVQERSLELAQQLAKENEVRVRVGQAPPLDLVQVQAEVANRREGLIRARAAADDGEDRLRRLIMDPQDGSFWQVSLDPTDDPAGRLSPPDVDAVVAKAINERYDVARARNDVSNAATNIEYFGNQKLPDVRLEASYRGNGLGGSQLLRTGTFPGVVTGRVDSGFGDVLGQVFGRDYPAWSFGMTVSYPIGHSYEELSAVRATVERRQAAARVASLQLDVAASLRQAARQIRSTAEREDAARAGATLAEERVRDEQRRYEAGLSTSFLVTQAQRDLLQSQVNLLQATLDYQSSLVNFEALQLAPPVSSGASIALQGSNVVPLPTPAPRGLFRTGVGTGF
jgi:outer membrane protein TolC